MESLGHALLSDIQKNDTKFGLRDLVDFANLVMGDFWDRQKKEIDGQKLVQEDQTIPENISSWMMPFYCYWKSAELYNMIGDYRDEKRSYGQIMHLLEIYFNHNKDNILQKEQDGLLEQLLDFSKYVRGLQIKAVNSLYEHINVLEKGVISGWLGVASEELDSRYLSFYSDIEEVDYCYYRFVVAYCKCKNSNGGKVAGIMLRGIERNAVYQNATLSAMINKHRLILQMYKYYLEEFSNRCGGNGEFNSLLDVEPDIVDRFIEKDSALNCVNLETDADDLDVVRAFLEQEKNKERVLQCEGPCENFKNCKHFEHCTAFKKREDFKNCKDCKKCENCKKYENYKMYKFRLLNEILLESVQRSDEIMRRMVGPLQVTTLFNHTFQANVYSNYMVFLKLYKQLEMYYEKNKNKLNVQFRQIDFGKVKYADERYLAERTLQSYANVRGCHQQKQAYRDLMHQLYFLEDDFNNETIQFYLATERVSLSDIAKKERELKQYLYSKEVIFEDLRHYGGEI